MHHKFSVQYNLLIADYKKLDRDLNEALQEKLGLEEELREFNMSYINLQRQNQQLDKLIQGQREKYSG